MALLQKPVSLLLLFAFVLSWSDAKFIPQDEVQTLQVISQKLMNNYWRDLSRHSCNDGGHTFNQTFAGVGMFSNVTCDCSFNNDSICHVTGILLKGLSLSGVFPEEFANLPQLQVIDLSGNYVSGTIPPSLSKIPLTNVSLAGNQITGTIPREVGDIATLMELNVEDNQIGGQVPPNLGNLKNLEKMVLSGNSFYGSIPETFSDLKNLKELRLNGVNISGVIPEFIGYLTNLNVLDIQGTSMQGPIPSSFSLLANLTILRISDLNTTSMAFPNLTGLTNLRNLVLRNCFITGPIPNYVQNLSNLKLLDLSYNQLSGPIPDSMAKLQRLKYMFLTNNSLSGTVPSWISSRDNFDFSYNNFSGSSTVTCQQPNVNLVASYSSAKSNSVDWCLMKNLPCFSNPRYHSLFINCGGGKTTLQGHVYEEDTNPEGPSSFLASGQNWAYSSTGVFMGNANADFVAKDTSIPVVTSIYQTARLSPLSLKYYGLCMRRGRYNVKLHFAEIILPGDHNVSSIGKRIFDVAIQGNIVLKDYNIAAEARGVGKGILKEFNNVYVDSTLEIHLYWAGKGTTEIPQKGTYGPLISGITVTPNFRTGLSAGAITGIVLASCVLLVSILVILRKRGYLGRKRHNNEEFQGLNTGYFTLRQLKIATGDFNFRNKIGEGGFGPVYKGVLPDGKVIAVKQLSSKSKQGNREFVNEIGMISALQHPNLVKLHGCCIEGKELLLVYEYMENNSLAHALFVNQQSQLEWHTRKRICLGIARGLAYLHEESRLKIVHRDIKATNVLLDKDLNAKISDFGLAKLDEDENTHISTRIAGTIGYMAPEYAMRGHLTDKADVYSFGVVVLELVSGKSNASYRPEGESVYLLDWAYVLQEQGNLLELVDQSLGSNYSQEEALTLLNLALLCTNPSPTLRPRMSSVVSMIDGQLPVQPILRSSRVGMDEELPSKSLMKLSLDSQNWASVSSQSGQVMVRSSSTDAPWTGSSTSMQSKGDAQLTSPTSKLL